MKFLAAIIFILSFPLSFLIFLILKIFGKGPAIFKQIRIGKDKKEFIIYKFRTMTNNKVTFFGKILRKLGLDELPQLLNIIKGEMAFVGPRPLTQFDIDRLEWNDKRYIDRWSVKPGITGQAQLITICDKNLSIKEDLEYIKNKSVSLDIKIILKSIIIPIIGKRKMKKNESTS
ncbi:MAG: hypothetical protein C0596_12215 [Marinilabiliales bacterium]|nr:MAG: hypothetical protein C0596_12215 [Marinilabiliales bacterium]